jgi:Holliday junction resolvase RusA-like endonuclease
MTEPASFRNPPFARLDPIVIELDGQPVPKERPRFGQGRTYTAARTAAFETALGLAGNVAMRGRAPLDGALRVCIYAFFGVPKSWSKSERAAALSGQVRPTGRPDFDNCAKVIDALNKIVWLDDSQIVHATISKRYSDRPRFRIEVEVA